MLLSNDDRGVGFASLSQLMEEDRALGGREERDTDADDGLYNEEEEAEEEEEEEEGPFEFNASLL